MSGHERPGTPARSLLFMSPHFHRYTAPDPEAHALEIQGLSAAMSAARAGTDSRALIDASADLASVLTTARREAEAHDLLLPLLSVAREHASQEPAGWFLLSLGTASQYLGLREQANTLFAEALALAQDQGWERLEHFVLVHWGRSLVEERACGRARDLLVRALALRERQQHPGAERVRAMLQSLDELVSAGP